MTDYWIILFDLKMNKQFTKYFDCEFELDKYKRYLKHLGRYIILECSTDKYFKD